MYYPDELIEEIRISNDIVDVIGMHINLTKKGSSHFGLCPFHNEKSPSFSVSRDKQMYHCFGCGVGGNVITFVMEYENYSFVEAIKLLADRVHISLPEPELSEQMKKAMHYKQQLLDANKETAKYFYYQLKGEKGSHARKYLLDRGLEEDIRKKFGLGYALVYRDDLYQYLKNKGFTDSQMFDSGVISKNKEKEVYYDRFFSRIMFPIFDIHNRVVGFGGRVLGEGNPKYLNSPETKLFDKSRLLYGMNFARKAKKRFIILVEGYMDVIALHSAGFDNAVASLGTAFTSGQANLLKRYTDEIIICYDSDGAGLQAATRAIPILEQAGLIIRVVHLEGAKDPDEYIKTYGADAFEKVLDKAMPSFLFEIEQLEKDYHLKDPDHKTAFYQKIAERLVHISNEIKRENYFDAIVEKYKVKARALQNEMEKIGKNRGIVQQPDKAVDMQLKQSNHSKDSILLAQKNLLTFIGSHKDIYEAVKTYIDIEEFIDPTYKRIAEMLFYAYEHKETINPPSIINRFSELEEQNKVAQIFNNNIQLENQIQFEKMVNESVHIVKSAYIDTKSRSITDVSELQNLIQKKRALQGLYIFLNHG